MELNKNVKHIAWNGYLLTAIFIQLFSEMLQKITKFEMANLISLSAHCLYVISTILHFTVLVCNSGLPLISIYQISG